jgi:hypothetical protein
MFGVPVWKKDYTDKKRVAAVSEKILSYLQPGDIINFENCVDSWWDIAMSFALKLIVWDQKKVFGGNSRYKDHHTELFIDRDHIYSMEPPKGLYQNIEHICLDPITIYRFTKHKFNNRDIAEMKKISDQLVGVDYDIPQLLNILFNTLLGFPNSDKIKFFKKGFVCSVAIRTIYEKWRKQWNKKHEDNKDFVKIERLFNTLNLHLNPPGALVQRHRKGIVKDGVEIEMTSPAHFANSAFYGHAFEMVARFDNGEITT